MKRFLILTLLSLLLLGASSCKKTKYCQCFAFIDNEDIELGDDYYIIEEGTCNDKAKEIVGWGNVTCKEVDVEDDDEGWFWGLFSKKKNNNNNNNNH